MPTAITKPVDSQVTSNSGYEDSISFVADSLGFSTSLSDRPSRFHHTRVIAWRAAKKWVAGRTVPRIRHRAAIFGRKQSTDDSCTTLCPTDTLSGRSDSGYSTTCNESAAWEDWTTLTKISANCSGWDSSCADIDTTNTNTNILTTTICDEKTASKDLKLSPETKHYLATYLKRTSEESCFSFLCTHARWAIDLLRIQTYDTVDINIYVTLIGYLLAHKHLPSTALAKSPSGEVAWPDIKRWYDKTPSVTDNIGRLRQVAVHRWDYDTDLPRDVTSLLALLKDRTRITEIEDVFQSIGSDAIPRSNCTTRNELLIAFVSILERAFYIFASNHCPAVLAGYNITHAHALELQQLAVIITSALPGSFATLPATIREIHHICRDLRNAAAHHNSFTPEAIQGRQDGGTVVCRYDAFEDPYTAIAEDVEKVALLLRDGAAVAEIRLAVWSADLAVRRTEVKIEEEERDIEAKNYLRLARKAAGLREGFNMNEGRWEAEMTLFGKWDEAIAFFERRAADVVGLEVQGIFERWRRDVVGCVEYPGDEKEESLTW